MQEVAGAGEGEGEGVKKMRGEEVQGGCLDLVSPQFLIILRP